MEIYLETTNSVEYGNYTNLYILKKHNNIHKTKYHGAEIWHSEQHRHRFDTLYIVLKPNGHFTTLIDENMSFYGTWMCEKNELTLIRYSHKHIAYETYVGVYNIKNNNTIHGFYSYGTLDPQCIGQFSLTKILSQFDPIVPNPKQHKDIIFNTHHCMRKWKLEFHSNTFVSSFNIILHKNLTWNSIPESEHVLSRFGGYWNLFEKTIDITTGIHGHGTHIWLWMRQFGAQNANTQFMELTQDRLYVGTIHILPHNTSHIEYISGDVCIGWETEVAFIGTFSMY